MTTTFDSDINEEMAGVTEETPDITEYHVVGPPGCGKTTWLSRQVRRAVNTGQQVLISSLTRAAAAEVAGRDLPIPPESLGTLHSHCFQSLGRPEIAEAKKYVTEWNETYPNYCLSLGTNDLGTRIDGDNLEPTAGGTLGDRLMAEYQLARARMSTQLTPNASLFADKWEAWKKDRFLLDFTDLIQTCLQDVDYAPSGPDIIFVDEAQDMDLLEMSLIRKWGTNAGYLIVVGDPDQSIYTWRGADPQAFTSAASANPKNMVLAQSYRVPFQVHGHAVRWINNIVSRQPVEYLPTEELGEVRVHTRRLGGTEAGHQRRRQVPGRGQVSDVPEHLRLHAQAHHRGAPERGHPLPQPPPAHQRCLEPPGQPPQPEQRLRPAPPLPRNALQGRMEPGAARQLAEKHEGHRRLRQ